MSDGQGGGGLSGSFEFIGEQAQKGAQTVGNAAKSVAKTVAGQVTGNQQPLASPNLGGLSGEFIPGEVGKSNQKQGQQTQSGQVSSAQVMQNQATAVQDQNRIAEIKKELQWHQEHYFKPFLEKAEGRDRKTQVEAQEKAQEEQQKKMEDLQQEQVKKQNDSVRLAQRGTEIKGGSVG